MKHSWLLRQQGVHGRNTWQLVKFQEIDIEIEAG